MTEPRHLDLVDRLRGQYHLPVNDGAGPLNGSMTFSREFPTSPIHKEAADEIERLRAELDAAKSFMEQDERDYDTLRAEFDALEAATIERCAMAAEWFSNVEKFTAADVAKRIRAAIKQAIIDGKVCDDIA